MPEVNGIDGAAGYAPPPPPPPEEPPAAPAETEARAIEQQQQPTPQGVNNPVVEAEIGGTVNIRI